MHTGYSLVSTHASKNDVIENVTRFLINRRKITSWKLDAKCLVSSGFHISKLYFIERFACPLTLKSCSTILFLQFCSATSIKKTIVRIRVRVRVYFKYPSSTVLSLLRWHFVGFQAVCHLKEDSCSKSSQLSHTTYTYYSVESKYVCVFRYDVDNLLIIRY